MVDNSAPLIAALLSTGFISLAPNLILFAFPGYADEGAIEGSFALSMGQALAAGGLLGDVFLHTLPEAAGEDWGIWVLLGFTIFLVMDMVIRSLDDGHDHDHSHAASGDKKKDEKSSDDKASKRSTLAAMFTSSVLLNLTADALHNFTDGLAIGASFATAALLAHDQATWQSLLLSSRGGLATLSILFHEIPHELGDYCILLKSGFTKTEAIAAQFGTAIAAFVGTIVGLWAASTWPGVMYITAGGFVYLAAVTILPTVLAERKTNFTFRISQLCAFLIGIGFLYSVAFLEGADGHGHSHGHHGHHVAEKVQHARELAAEMRHLQHHDHHDHHEHQIVKEEVHHHDHHGDCTHDHNHHDDHHHESHGHDDSHRHEEHDHHKHDHHKHDHEL